MIKPHKSVNNIDVKKRERKIDMHTLKPPAVPALITRSGLNAWMEAYVTREAETVPTLSTPEKWPQNSKTIYISQM